MVASQASHKPGSEKEQDIASRLLKMIQDVAAELHPRQLPTRAINLDSQLDRDLGLDSLARAELLARIEKHFGIALAERVFAEAQTPRDLLRAVLSTDITRPVQLAPQISKIAMGEVEGTPQSAQTLVEALDWHAQAHGDRAHIQFYSDENTGEIISYRGLKDSAQAVAAGLQHMGVRHADAVAIMLPTGPEYFYSFFGILLAGAVPVPIYPPAQLGQIEEHLRRHQGILANSIATLLITVPEAKRVAQLLKSQVEMLRSSVTVNELASQAGALEQPVLGAQDIALMQYTSGSTGNPKGVVLTHANLLANIRVMGEAIQADATDVFVSWLPLYHDMGLIGAWLGSLYYGVPLVVMSPLAFLARPQRWLWAIHRYGGTLSAAPNFGYELCLRRLDKESLHGLDLSAWRLAFNGAEPISPATLQLFSQRLRPYGFRPEAWMTVYGLAESAVGLAFPPLGRGPLIDNIERETFMHSGRAIPTTEADKHALHMVSCGQPLPGHEIRIVDNNGRELPEREEGRLQFRGPSTTSGYFRNPDETRRLFHDDWLDSGDMAYIAHGEIYITGRSKDIIIRAGRNIYPQELEEAIGNISGIRKGCVAVVGSPDPDSGMERLVILAETYETDSQTLDRLRAQINTTTNDLAGLPADDIVFAPPHSILKTSSGKIRRAASRELYEHGRIGGPQRAVWWQITRVALASLLPQLRRAWRAAYTGLYATYAWVLFGLLAPPVWLAVALLPRTAWRWSVIHAGARLFARLSGTKLLVSGLHHLPPNGRPCVLVANHGSYLDGYALATILPRPFSFVAKAELQQKLLLRIFLKKIQASFVERFDKQKGVADARHVAQSVRSGRSLIFFPEGTFTRIPGLMSFHMGAFVAAQETGIPVLPVAIRGTRSILRAGSWFARHGGISVTIGEAIDPQAIQAQMHGDPWKTALKLRDQAREYILRYCGEPDLGREKSPV